MEAAVLVPVILVLTITLIMVMLFQFQSLLMTTALHQKGLVQTCRSETRILALEALPTIAGQVRSASYLNPEGRMGIRTLMLTAELKPSSRWIQRLRPVKSRSFHLKMQLPLVLYLLSQQNRSHHVVPE